MTNNDLSGISLLYHSPTNHVFLSGYEWTRTINLSTTLSTERSNQLSYTPLSPIYDL